MRRFIVYAALAACISLNTGGAFAASQYVYARSGPIRLTGHGVSQAEADRCARFAEDQLQEIGKEWGLHLDQSVVEVRLESNRKVFEELYGDPKSVDNMTGFAHWPKSAGGAPIAVVDMTSGPDDVDCILRHEITHAAIMHGVGLKVCAFPIWFDEGMAILRDSGRAENHQTAKNSDICAQIGSIARLESVLAANDDRVYDAGAAGADLVDSIIQRHGTLWIGRMLTSMKNGEDWQPALERATGESLAEIEEAWLSELWPWLETSQEISLAVVILPVICFCLAAFICSRCVLRRYKHQSSDDAPGDPGSPESC